MRDAIRELNKRDPTTVKPGSGRSCEKEYIWLSSLMRALLRLWRLAKTFDDDYKRAMSQARLKHHTLYNMCTTRFTYAHTCNIMCDTTCGNILSKHILPILKTCDLVSGLLDVLFDQIRAMVV